MKPIIFALITSLCYGLSGPIVKVGFNKGMHPDGFALAYAVGLMSYSLMTLFQKGYAGMYPTTASLGWGIAAGVLCAVGFRLSAIALAVPDSLVAVIVVIGATYPLISCMISLPMLGESARVILPKLVAGALLIIGGTYLVSTSVR